MKFQSIDELEQFRFHDACLVSVTQNGSALALELEAVVVRGSHPLNETYTDRYADTLYLRFVGGELVKAFREGYKYYDANDVPIEEIPDEEVAQKDFEALREGLRGGHIFVLEQPESLKEKLGSRYPEQMDFCLQKKKAFPKTGTSSKFCIMAVDVDCVEEEKELTYWLALSYDKAILEWEHLLNKSGQ